MELAGQQQLPADIQHFLQQLPEEWIDAVRSNNLNQADQILELNRRDPTILQALLISSFMNPTQSIVKLLVEKYGASVSLPCRLLGDYTPLIAVCFFGDFAGIVEYLMERGADPRVTFIRNGFLYSVLETAVRMNRVEVVRLLCPKGEAPLVDVNEKWGPRIEMNALSYAITEQQRAIYEILIPVDGIDLEMIAYGKNTLGLAAIFWDEHAVALLLKHGADACSDNIFREARTLGSQCNWLLLLAVMVGNCYWVEQLLKNNVGGWRLHSELHDINLSVDVCQKSSPETCGISRETTKRAIKVTFRDFFRGRIGMYEEIVAAARNEDAASHISEFNAAPMSQREYQCMRYACYQLDVALGEV